MQCSTSGLTARVQNYQDYSDNAGEILELTFIQQSTAFLYSILLGVALGVLYGPFKIFRLAFCRSRAAIIAADVLYMLIATLSVFMFSLAFLLGYIRIYVFAGCLLGFFAYRLTLGKLFSKIYCPLISVIVKILHKICAVLKKFAKKLLKTAYKIMYNISNIKSKYINKQTNTATDKRVFASNEKRKDKNRKKSDKSDSRRKHNKRNNAEKA